MTLAGNAGANVGGNAGGGTMSVAQVIDTTAAAFTQSTTTYTQRLSQGITLQAGSTLLLDGIVSYQQPSTSRVFMRIRINGTTWRSGNSCNDTEGGSVTIPGAVVVGASGLVAGANTITVDIRAADTNTVTCNPANDGQGLHLRLVELLA